MPFARHEIRADRARKRKGRSTHSVHRYRRVTYRRCYVEAGAVVAECVEQVAQGVAYVVVPQPGELPPVGVIASQGLD